MANCHQCTCGFFFKYLFVDPSSPGGRCAGFCSQVSFYPPKYPMKLLISKICLQDLQEEHEKMKIKSLFSARIVIQSNAKFFCQDKELNSPCWDGNMMFSCRTVILEEDLVIEIVSVTLKLKKENKKNSKRCCKDLPKTHKWPRILLSVK